MKSSSSFSEKSNADWSFCDPSLIHSFCLSLQAIWPTWSTQRKSWSSLWGTTSQQRSPSLLLWEGTFTNADWRLDTVLDYCSLSLCFTWLFLFLYFSIQYSTVLWVLFFFLQYSCLYNYVKVLNSSKVSLQNTIHFSFLLFTAVHSCASLSLVRCRWIISSSNKDISALYISYGFM